MRNAVAFAFFRFVLSYRQARQSHENYGIILYEIASLVLWTARNDFHSIKQRLTFP